MTFIMVGDVVLKAGDDVAVPDRPSGMKTIRLTDPSSQSNENTG